MTTQKDEMMKVFKEVSGQCNTPLERKLSVVLAAIVTLPFEKVKSINLSWDMRCLGSIGGETVLVPNLEIDFQENDLP